MVKNRRCKPYSSRIFFGLTRCAKYALQIEFRHIDETGAQWVNVAKSYSTSDNKLFIQQVQIWKDWSRR